MRERERDGNTKEPTRRDCLFTNTLKLDSLTELTVFTSSRVARSIGMPIFPSAVSQGVGGGLVPIEDFW
ncbi:hypothetical protein [Chamaesiphon sp.]|uniref:hypothetical protein n=1 Tax=Chamaesiphon sp. TaxID=2814140 RepID=UPI003593220B